MHTDDGCLSARWRFVEADPLDWECISLQELSLRLWRVAAIDGALRSRHWGRTRGRTRVGTRHAHDGSLEGKEAMYLCGVGRSNGTGNLLHKGSVLRRVVVYRQEKTAGIKFGSRPEPSSSTLGLMLPGPVLVARVPAACSRGSPCWLRARLR